MFAFIKTIFIRLLTSVVNSSNYLKCESLSNQQCMIEATLINLHPNEYSQGLRYYPFAFNLDRCAGSCNTLNYASNKVSHPNKAEDLNLSVFNTIAEINESKTLTHLSCRCECKCDGRKCKSN